MGERDTTPNHKEIIINSIQHVLCAGEDVDLRGQLKLAFGVSEFWRARRKARGHKVTEGVQRYLPKHRTDVSGWYWQKNSS